MTTSPAVVIDGLTKRYGSRAAVDALTVDIPYGVTAGFVGPNGAGKTTTMAMLLGLVRPTAGGGEVLGSPISRPERYLGRVGALVEGPGLWPALTATENVAVVARLAGHDPARIPWALDLVGLGERAGDRYGSYSLGMKQRLGIAAALLGDPELLVLDEPTNGLDPVGIIDMRDLIGRLGAGGRTVLVSSHLLGELEQVCDWLIVIDQGRLVYAGDLAGFAATAAPDIVLAPADVGHLLRLADVLSGSGVEAGRDGDRLVVPVPDGHGDPRALAGALNHAAASAGIVLSELHVRRPTLEANYLSLVEGARR
ncbi:MAG TPA: ATP-binding cassette domain-containing protein [Acidimicrobiales bacterium]|nr:ATP-binding cassette domain-containing protein [Acidimicrobiales bacterium]